MGMAYGTPRARWAITLLAALLLAILSFIYLSNTFQPSDLQPHHDKDASTEPIIPEEPTPREWPTYEVVALHESFPEVANAKSADDIPRVPSWNKPPEEHVKEATPLFIGFTRNWQMLQQVVVSYIAAGWPPQDIYVVENTGVMDSNLRGRLTEENPFYLDHRRLGLLGVNVLIAPTYLTFAQLQNFYLFEAITKKYPAYFWSHMDVIALAEEDRDPYQSFYMRAVDALREALDPNFARDGEGREGRWSVRFFAYDWLTLVNTAIHVEMGGWDTMISYYKTDCDLYERFRMAHMPSSDARAGKIWDVSTVLPDLGVLYRRKPVPGARDSSTENERQWTDEEDVRNSSAWHSLRDTLQQMQDDKGFGTHHRNSWQRWRVGGEGQPFYKDVNGFEESLEIAYRAGEAVYRSKWGTGECNLFRLRPEDAWHVNQWKDH